MACGTAGRGRNRGESKIELTKTKRELSSYHWWSTTNWQRVEGDCSLDAGGGSGNRETSCRCVGDTQTVWGLGVVTWTWVWDFWELFFLVCSCKHAYPDFRNQDMHVSTFEKPGFATWKTGKWDIVACKLSWFLLAETICTGAGKGKKITHHMSHNWQKICPSHPKVFPPLITRKLH